MLKGFPGVSETPTDLLVANKTQASVLQYLQTQNQQKYFWISYYNGGSV